MADLNRKWLRWFIPVTVLVLLAVLAGVVVAVHGSGRNSSSGLAQSAATSQTASPVGTGYLASSSTEAIFIQWNQAGSSVTGTAQDDQITGAPPNESLSTQTISVSGQLNGSSISLSFNGSTQEFGTISSGSFTLNFPQKDGSLAPVTFQQSSPANFNADVASMNSAISHANAAEAAREQTHSEQSTINADINTVDADISSLNGTSFASDLQALPGQLQQAQSDLANAASEAQTAQSESGSVNQCSDAASSQSDSDAVQSDADQVSGIADNVESDVNSARGSLVQASKDFAQLQQDESNLPSYQPPAPSQSDLNQATATAQQAVAAAIATMNAGIDQVNGYQATAYQDSSAALNSGSCGPPAPAPTPISHIS